MRGECDSPPPFSQSAFRFRGQAKTWRGLRQLLTGDGSAAGELLGKAAREEQAQASLALRRFCRSSCLPPFPLAYFPPETGGGGEGKEGAALLRFSSPLARWGVKATTPPPPGPLLCLTDLQRDGPAPPARSCLRFAPGPKGRQLTITTTRGAWLGSAMAPRLTAWPFSQAGVD